MDEETRSRDARAIPLSPAQYRELERAMQWPEDLARWDRIDKPTPVFPFSGPTAADRHD